MENLSLPVVFVAGILTFFSPCVLPLVPVYLSLMSRGLDEKQRFAPVVNSIFFVLGFSVVFSLLGLSASGLGRFLLKHKEVFERLAGLFIFLLGLRFLGYLQLPFSFSRFQTMQTGAPKTGVVSAFLLGFAFAFGFSPCVGSVLGAVLTYASLATTGVVEGAFWLFVYSLGFGLPLVLLALFIGKAQAFVSKTKHFLPVFEKVTGGLLLATGILLLTSTSSILYDPLSKEPAEIAEAQPIADGQTCSAESGSCEAFSVEETNKPIILEFYAPNCPICQQMVPIIGALKKECIAKEVEVRQVNVKSPEGKALAQQYGINGIPVFVFLSKEGKEVARLVGFQSLESLERTASVLIGEECRGYRRLQ